MKRLILIVVAVSTFCIGIELTSLRRNHSKSDNLVLTFKYRSPKKPLLDGIKPTVRACGNGYTQGYVLPDGKRLGEGNYCSASFKAATREMKVWLSDANRIIETVAPTKHAGESKSERVVASFPKDEFGDEWIKIFWIHGECIHWISAPDLNYALEFERSQLNPYKFEE